MIRDNHRAGRDICRGTSKKNLTVRGTAPTGGLAKGWRGRVLTPPILAFGLLAGPWVYFASQPAHAADTLTNGDTKPPPASLFTFPQSAIVNPAHPQRKLLPGNNINVSAGADVNAEYRILLGKDNGGYFSLPPSLVGTGNLFRVVMNGETNDFTPITRTIGYEFIYGGRLTFFSLAGFNLQRAYLYFGGGIWNNGGHIPFGIISVGKDFGVLTRYALDGSSVLAPGGMKYWQTIVGADGVASNGIVEGYGRSSPDNFDTSAKVAYQTPVIYGFSAAVSYAPSGVLWSQNPWASSAATHKNVVDAVLNYHANIKTINHEFLFDVMGGYEHATVLPAYSNQNHQFLDGFFKSSFINTVVASILKATPTVSRDQALITAQQDYELYVSRGQPTDSTRAAGYQSLTPGAAGFGLSNQEAYHLGFKFGYNPLNITRSLENIFAGANNDLRYGNSDAGDNQFRDNDNRNVMGDFFALSLGMNWNKLYGNLLSAGISLRPLAFLSIYGGYAYGTCATQSCMAARFINRPGSSHLWTSGLTFALSNDFFIYTQASGIIGNVEFGRYDAAGYLYGQTNGFFNKTNISVGTMMSF